MKERNPIMVAVLGFITLGIYPIVWFVQTKDEMNTKGADIPTAWLLIIPIVSLYWVWKYCQGTEKVTGGKMSTVVTLLVLVVLGPIGMAILQDSYNKIGQ